MVHRHHHQQEAAQGIDPGIAARLATSGDLRHGVPRLDAGGVAAVDGHEITVHEARGV